LGHEQNPAIGLRQQSAPSGVFVDQLIHVPSGFVGEQVNIQAVQLNVIDGGGEPIIVTGNQQMVTGFVLSQLGHVSGHGLENDIAGLACRGVKVTHHLILGKLGVWGVGVPINALNVQVQTRALQSMDQGRHQGHAIAWLGLTARLLGLAKQPRQVVAVDQCDAATRACVARFFARRVVTWLVLHAVWTCELKKIKKSDG
jgi:hypothetical protein